MYQNIAKGIVVTLIAMLAGYIGRWIYELLKRKWNIKRTYLWQILIFIGFIGIAMVVSFWIIEGLGIEKV